MYVCKFFSFYFPLQFEGSTPSDCWNKIFKRIKKIQTSSSDGSGADGGGEKIDKTGSDMFGFSNPEVVKLIQVNFFLSKMILLLNFHSLQLTPSVLHNWMFAMSVSSKLVNSRSGTVS